MLGSIENYDFKKASFKTWLYKIATFKIIDYYRSKEYKQQSIWVNINEKDMQDDYIMKFKNLKIKLMIQKM